MYRATPTSATQCLRQSEIISDLIQAKLALESVGSQQPVALFSKHPFAILMTQDCDLEQDFAVRRKREISDKLLPALLFCELATAEELFGRLGGRRKEWDREKVDRNKNERYHFLQQIDPSCDARQVGLPELAIDFKRYFTVPTDEVYRRIELEEAKRRCMLTSPYMEHLGSRFAYFLSRIALPLDHASD